MDRIKNYFIRAWDSEAMLTLTPIQRSVYEHLLTVYFTLFYSSIFALSGAILHQLFNIGGWISAHGFIGSLWCLSRVNPWREIPRDWLLMAAAFFSGATLGPLINLIIEMDQSNVIKIIMGALVFFASYLAAIASSRDRTVIYQFAEYSTPILITTWMVMSDTYPGLRTHTVCLVTLPFQWYSVVHIGAFVAGMLKRWLNVPIHMVWILALCYIYEHTILDLMASYLLKKQTTPNSCCFPLQYVYAILMWLFVHMNLCNQLAIHQAIHNPDENYYVSTTITFFTEFPFHIINLLIHPFKGTVNFLYSKKKIYFDPSFLFFPVKSDYVFLVVMRVYAVLFMVSRIRRHYSAAPAPRRRRSRGGRT
ncbi:hypothetical protein OSB04_011270 [Centaurea solstitialis]|uniref:Uncharacterized protein n=1 Tax=Centaurea solstitialis TaxID=347529 RepID=A0AA38WPY9_9ASTR|nr:hypothetical protein OSB04_011270 [Centaurea solstitialis]